MSGKADGREFLFLHSNYLKFITNSTLKGLNLKDINF